MGYGLVFPAATALVAGANGAGRRGMAFGVFYAVYSFGVVVGASGSGRLAAISDDLVGLPFLVAAAVVLAAVPLVAVLRYAATNTSTPSTQHPYTPSSCNRSSSIPKW